MDRTSRKRVDKECETLNKSINDLDLANAFRTCHPITAKQTFFSTVLGTVTFSRINNILNYKINLNTFKDFEIMQSMFLDHSVI